MELSFWELYHYSPLPTDGLTQQSHVPAWPRGTIEFSITQLLIQDKSLADNVFLN